MGDPRLASRHLVYYCDDDPAIRANTAYLLGAFLVPPPPSPPLPARPPARPPALHFHHATPRARTGRGPGCVCVGGGGFRWVGGV